MSNRNEIDKEVEANDGLQRNVTMFMIKAWSLYDANTQLTEMIADSEIKKLL